MRRNVSVRLEMGVSEPALLALQIAVATPDRHERLSVTINGATVPAREVAAPHDGRMHVIQASPGDLLVDYEAEVSGHMGWP
ncbi:MAG TPA: hypothetical protein VMM13_06430, partial [Euzebya sp.]|nr:hypothetical protein [Euzebya sp.]